MARSFGTVEDYRRAFARVLPTAAKNQIALIRAHLESPTHTASAKELARAIGVKEFVEVNRTYARLAKAVAGHLGIMKPAEGFWLFILADWAEGAHSEGNTRFRLRPEVVQALADAELSEASNGRLGRHLVVYWTKDQLEIALNRGRLDFAGSDQFQGMDVRTGDTLWICGTSSPRDLITIGPLSVKEVLSKHQAVKKLPEGSWEARRYALADPKHVVTPRLVSLAGEASELRFISKTKPKLDLSKHLGNQLQRIRVLTTDSAARIAEKWGGTQKAEMRVQEGGLVLGRRYSREQIGELLGGGDPVSYLPRVNGKVSYGCFDPKMNERAPFEIDIGDLPRVRAAADEIFEARKEIPVFLKRASAQWEYVGRYRPVHYSQDASDLFPANPSRRENAVAVLYFETTTSNDIDLWNDPIVSDAAALEGGTKLVRHLRRERQRWLVDAKRRVVVAERGELICEICGLRSKSLPADVGDACFEVHHLIPLATAGESITRLQDLALLCANCHRMVHRKTDLVEPAALKEALQQATAALDG